MTSFLGGTLNKKSFQTNNMAKDHLAQLDFILNNHFIDEVGITLDTNLPPIFYTEGKLGLAKTILKPLFQYALESLYELKLHSEACVDDVSISAHAISITRVVLLIKGDFPIAYDLRKRLILMGVLTTKDEISFTSLLYTRHPKCPSGWQHRRWCLQLGKPPNSNSLSLAEVETERELCKSMAEKHPKNYYAWVHRLWVLKYMSMYQLEDELFFTRDWLHAHVSDHSAVNHRIQVVRQITRQHETLSYIMATCNPGIPNLYVPFLELIFSESEQLVRSRPGHEALWCLRRSLLELLFVKVCTSLNDKDGNVSLHMLGKMGITREESSSFSWPLHGVDEIGRPPIDSSSTNQSFTMLNSTLRTSNSFICTKKDVLSWVLSLLAHEMRLVWGCVDDETAWDYAAQRAMATRYAAFLLDRVAHYTIAITDTADADADTMAAAVAGMNSSSLTSAHAYEDGLTPLSVALSAAMRRICATLQAEGMRVRYSNSTSISSMLQIILTFSFCFFQYHYMQIPLLEFGTTKRKASGNNSANKKLRRCCKHRRSLNICFKYTSTSTKNQ